MSEIRRLQLRDGHVGSLSAIKIAALIMWCANPTPDPDEIERILNDLSDDDVKHVMLFGPDVASRVAWLEYGRRMKFAKFDVGLSVTDDTVALTYTGEGPAVHGLALYVEPEDEQEGG